MGKPQHHRGHVTKREIVQEGGLLKHKNKKIQGFARRYFWLDSNGVLSYAVSPHAHIRDSVNVGMATIARSKASRSIHIDSDRMTWHLKAQTDSDFQTWTNALRKFIPVMEKGGGGVAGNAPQKPEVNVAEVSDYLTRMTAPIKDLEIILQKMESQDNNKETPGKPLAKIKNVLKHSHNNNNNSEAAEQEADDLRKAHAQIFRYHQRLLEIVSPSKAAGPLGPEEGAVKVDAPLIASRTAIGFKGGDAGDSDDEYEDARDFDLDDSQSGYTSAAASSAPGSEEDDDDDSGSDSSSQTSVESDDTAKEDDHEKDDTKRRSKLDKPAQADPSSAFSVLKNNIGKDLTKISFPVSFNEPLSALQRQAEELEHPHLLRKAAHAKDMTEKLAYIAAFAISGLAGTKTRAARKPFNPLLGETYELIRPDKQYKFFSEKVSHHPPINAFWARDDHEKWTLEGATTASQKYWGRSLEVFPAGTTKLTLGDDEFTWEQRPNATVRGMMGGGEKTLEYTGKLIIKHAKSKAKVTVNFKEGSKFGGGGDKGKIEGKIVDDNGSESGELTGKWDESVQLKTGQDSYKELFKYKGISKESDCGFGWGVFACQLNEITELEKDKLPVTDTRLRPDQRSYEDGDPDKADKQKESLENAQRERRKKWEEGHGKEAQPPIWFSKGKGEHDYEYKGKYFEQREKGEWSDEVKGLKIFDDA